MLVASSFNGERSCLYVGLFLGVRPWIGGGVMWIRSFATMWVPYGKTVVFVEEKSEMKRSTLILTFEEERQRLYGCG